MLLSFSITAPSFVSSISGRGSVPRVLRAAAVLSDADDSADIISAKDAEIERLRKEMEKMQEELKAKEAAVEQARKVAVSEAVEIIAEAELNDLLFGTWSKSGGGDSAAAMAAAAAGASATLRGEDVFGVWSRPSEVSDAEAGRNEGATSFDEWLKVSELPPLQPSGVYTPPNRMDGRVSPVWRGRGGRGNGGRGGRGGRGNGQRLTPRQRSVQRAAQAAIDKVNGVDSAISFAREVRRSSGPRPELVPTGKGHERAKKEVLYRPHGRVPKDFPRGLITALVEKRSAAKLARNFSEADRLQRRISAMGVNLDDRRRTWSVVKGWSKMQKKEAKAEARGAKQAGTFATSV